MQRGILTTWNAEHGFGYIKPELAHAPKVYIHISTLKNMAREPIVGDVILFQTDLQTKGEPRAAIAKIEGVSLKTTPKAKSCTDLSMGPFIQWLAVLTILAFAGYKILLAA